MSRWRSVKAKQLLAALLRIGWAVAWQSGSHRRLKRTGWANYTFAFHDGDEIGAGLLAQMLRRPDSNRMICKPVTAYNFVTYSTYPICFNIFSG